MPRKLKMTAEPDSISAPIISSVSAAPAKQLRALPAIVVLIILLLLALGIAGYFYYQYRQSAQVKNVEETEELVMILGQMMELPHDEKPTLATVTDKAKLAEQAFFQKAENGDKVVIYSQSGRAILYRPSTGKIVDVTTVNVSQPTTDNQPPATAEAPAVEATALRATILNGSEVKGAANTVETTLKPLFPNITVVTKTNAVKDYTQAVVVDITGQNAEVAQKVATALNARVVTTVPIGETAPTDSDLLVIYGAPTGAAASSQSSAGSAASQTDNE